MLFKVLEVNCRIKTSFVRGRVVLPFDLFDHQLNFVGPQNLA